MINWGIRKKSALEASDTELILLLSPSYSFEYTNLASNIAHSMPGLHRNVWLLTAAQALTLTVNSVIVFVGGIVGSQIAPEEKMATLPVAAAVVGTALSTVPVTLFMRKVGRKRAFTWILLFSVGIAALCAYAISIQSFYLFCISTLLTGITNACVMQFRFASVESVSPSDIPKAASFVLLGGIVAAFLGPEIAVRGKDLLATEFSGSFLTLGLMFALACVILQFFVNPIVEKAETQESTRSLREIAQQPVFWLAISSGAIGYVIMTFVMTATPVSMHVMDGHSLDHTKSVIQSHIVAMFLPSLFTPWIMKRLGVKKMMLSGLLAYLLCVGVAIWAHDLVNYWVALIALGIGWNFLFVGGTTLLPLSYRPHERFKVQALNEFMVFGSQATAALTAGWFIFAFSWETLLLIVIPIAVLEMLLVWRLGKNISV